MKSQAISVEASAPGTVPAAAFTVPAGARTGANPFLAVRHDTIAAVRDLWRSFQNGEVATVYQRLHWAELIVSHLLDPKHDELVLVEVSERRSGEPVLLLPLVRRRKRSGTAIEFLDCGVCDFAAPLVKPGYTVEPQAAAAMWEAVRAVLPRADRIHIKHIAHRVGGQPNPLAALPGVRVMPYHAHGVPVDGDPTTVVKRVTRSSTHRDIRKGERKLEQAGDYRLVTPSTAAEVDELFDVLVRQRLDRFRELGRYDLLTVPAVRDFYRAAAHDGLSGGPVRMGGLQAAGEWVTITYGLVDDRAFHGCLLSISSEERWLKCSPGLVAIGRAMECALECGLRYVDFTVGDLPYKTSFNAESRDLYEFAVPLSLRGRLVNGAEQGAAALKSRIAEHPALFNAIRSVFQFARRHASRPSEDPTP